MKKSDLRKYAKLIAIKGINVKKDQYVIINSSVSEALFASMVQEECYKAGAKYVKIDFSYDKSIINDYKYASSDTLKEFPKHKEAEWEFKLEKLPAMIYITSEDPDALNSIDQNKQMEVRKANAPKIWKYRGKMEGKYQWCIVAMPGQEWAKKVFPNLSKSKAKEALWQAIKLTTRLDGDPIENWNKKQLEFDQKCKALKDLNITKLIYKNSLGTDFSVGLIPNTSFVGGKSVTEDGVVYLPNIPTEECFTTPDKFSANGKVMSSKPLSLMGNVIDNFGFEFKDGKVINVIARNDKEKDLLNKLIDMDPNGGYLGEVALVPYDSPVNQTGLLFYETLFDENAACHLALGMGFDEVIDSNLTEEQLNEVKSKINECKVHTDFMIGTKDLSIKALLNDGRIVDIFVDGTWAI